MATFLAVDGSWGSAEGLLIFDINTLPEDIVEVLENDPEGAYPLIYEWLGITPTA